MPIGGTAFYGANQHPRITTPYLNSLNRHGDPAPGLNVSTEQMSGHIAQPYYGFAGGKLTITNPWAPQFADPDVGPLYGGVYMYLRLDPGDPLPVERGQPVFWQDELNYIVTQRSLILRTWPGGQDYPRKLAGVAVNGTLPGRWDFFQVAGIATVKFPPYWSPQLGDLIRVDPREWQEIYPGGPSIPIGLAKTSYSGAWHQEVMGTVVFASYSFGYQGGLATVELNIAPGPNF